MLRHTTQRREQTGGTGGVRVCRYRTEASSASQGHVGISGMTQVLLWVDTAPLGRTDREVKEGELPYM